MQNDDWIKFFSDVAARAGLALSPQQCGMFLLYMRELLAWNRTTNITRIVEPRSIAIKHFLDSILVARYVDTARAHIADVGSGGGFPGIPLAILDPGCSVVLIESVRKKCTFLKYAIRSLGLTNAEAYNGRAQDYPAPLTFDLAVSRALGSLEDFAAIAARLIKPHGSIVCMKGQLPHAEIAALKKRAAPALRIDTHTYCLPEQGDARGLVIIHQCFT